MAEFVVRIRMRRHAAGAEEESHDAGAACDWAQLPLAKYSCNVIF